MGDGILFVSDLPIRRVCQDRLGVDRCQLLIWFNNIDHSSVSLAKGFMSECIYCILHNVIDTKQEEGGALN